MKINHRGRITSRHNVLLPPKKKKSYSKYITLQFVIKGTIPSKKNMIWADSNINLLLSQVRGYKSATSVIDWIKKNLRVYIRNSKKYTDWVVNTKDEITRQAQVECNRYSKHNIMYPLNNVSVKVYHYWADNIERDNSNKYDSIIDLFVSCGILTNDCWQVVKRNESEAENYKGEILNHITLVDITCMI
mgnify:CR=1 FL=1